MSSLRRASLGLVRRQYGWFKLTDGRIRWLEAGDARLVERALELVEAYIAGRREGRDQ